MGPFLISTLAPSGASTGCHTQPPIHATAALRVCSLAPDRERARGFLEDLYPRLEPWHDYLYRERDPAAEHLVAIRHPWESGQDNSPIWDAVFERIAFRPEEVPPYRRADLGVAEAADRPEDHDYDRYVYLLGLFRERDWDEGRIRADTPFMVQDALFNALLVQAEGDLAEIARLLGRPAERFLARAERTAARLDEKLWHAAHGTYFDYDLRGEACIHGHSATGAVPLFAGVPDRERAQGILAYLNRGGFCPLEEDCWAVPSYDREAAGFDPRRYWRGPIWININWLLLQGLLRYGFEEYADKVRRAIVELPRRSGFFEYYDPETLEGRGSERFSWTAALLLDVLAGDLGIDVGGQAPPRRSVTS